MTKRKPLGKKTRFEVFKRDSFTCQYCGSKAPDVILHADHINPVSKGGDNSILNLITACEACNGGKGARRLDDNAEIDKQRAQLEELNERRQQMEWMLEWRDELSQLKDSVVASVAAFWAARAKGFYANENGLKSFTLWLKKFDLDLLLRAIETCADQYIEFKEDGSATAESVNKAFDMIPRVAAGILREAEKPWLKDVYYIRAILRNRLSYIHERDAVTLTEKAIVECFVETDALKDLAKRVTSWSQYRDAVQREIDDFEAHP